MWLIKDSKGKIKYLRPGKTIKFGRKQADIILANDTSISRAHAEITITLKEQVKTSTVSSTCIVKDANSKYGTFVIRNGNQMRASAEGIKLQHSDTIKFGLQQHIFTVEYINFVTVVSRLNSNDQAKLLEIMDCIDGVVIDSFDDNCTHVTMSSATLTNKVVLALVAGIPIVSMNYWTSVQKAIESDDSLPDTSLFVLPLQDKGINTQRASLKPNPKRKTLFNGKKFIFFSKETFDDYEKIIKAAGGMAELHSIHVKTIPERYFTNDHIIMQITASDDENSMDLSSFSEILSSKLLEKKIRLVAEAEIALAIAYATLDQYCNPRFNFQELIKRKSLKKDTTAVLALDTQDVLAEPNNAKIGAADARKIFIPESNDDAQESLKISRESLLKDNELTSFGKLSKVVNESKVDYSARLKSNLSEPTLSVGPESSTKNDYSSKTNHNIVVDKSKLNVEISRKKTENESLRVRADAGKFKDTNPCENNTKKRKISDIDDTDENCKTNWKTKDTINVPEPSKRKRNLFEHKDVFEDLDRQKKQFTEKKESKLSKWGFKKSEKRSIDFDLDDFDDTDSTVTNDSKKDAPSTSAANEESTSSLGKRKQSQPLQSNKSTSQSCTRSDLDENLMKKVDGNWTFGESSSQIKSKNKDMQKESRIKESFVRSTLPQRSAGNDINFKLFKKVYHQTPANRIALLDMSING